MTSLTLRATAKQVAFVTVTMQCQLMLSMLKCVHTSTHTRAKHQPVRYEYYRSLVHAFVPQTGLLDCRRAYIVAYFDTTGDRLTLSYGGKLVSKSFQGVNIAPCSIIC